MAERTFRQALLLMAGHRMIYWITNVAGLRLRVRGVRDLTIEIPGRVEPPIGLINVLMIRKREILGIVRASGGVIEPGAAPEDWSDA